LPGRHVVKAAGEVRIGSEVAVRLHRGELTCVVQAADSVAPVEG
jgi:ribosomal 50S subunit-recycling heat shock protein